MNDSLISVVCAVYNAESYINEAIDSLYNQSYKNTEIIVIDDGSDDTSLSRMDKYLKYPNFKLIKRFHTGNVGKLLNEAIKLSSGNYIAVMAADDVWEFNKLEKQLKHVNEYKMICTNAKLINAKGEIITERYFNDFNSDKVFLIDDLLKENYVVAPSVMLFKEILSECGYFEEKIGIRGEDYVLWLNIAKKHKIKFLNDTLVRYRIHSNNLSFKSNDERIKLLLRTADIRSEFFNDENYFISKSAKLGCVRLYKELSRLFYINKKYCQSKEYAGKLILSYPIKLSIKYFKYCMFYLLIYFACFIMGDKK